jgi:hypothetical protein
MVTMIRRKMKWRKMRRRWRRRLRRRRRIRMTMMAKNLGQLAREIWSIHQLTMLIPWQTMRQQCYLSKARRCASMPHPHNIRPRQHGHKPQSLSHIHEHRRLIR